MRCDCSLPCARKLSRLALALGSHALVDRLAVRLGKVGRLMRTSTISTPKFCISVLTSSLVFFIRSARLLRITSMKVARPSTVRIVESTIAVRRGRAPSSERNAR